MEQLMPERGRRLMETQISPSLTLLFSSLLACFMDKNRYMCSLPTARCNSVPGQGTYTAYHCSRWAEWLFQIRTRHLTGGVRVYAPSILSLFRTISMVSGIVYSYKAYSSKAYNSDEAAPPTPPPHNAPLPLGYCRSWWSFRRRIHAAR